MSGIRVNEWLHNSGTGGIWQSSAGNVGIASSVPAAKLVVTGDVNVSGALTATNFNGGQLGNRNLMINGAMQVAQRATSAVANGYASVDRWKFSGSYPNASALTQAQHALTSSDTGPWAEGFRSSYHITNNTNTVDNNTRYMQIEQKLEAQDIANSGWDYTNTSKHLTLSFWIKSSVAQTFYGRILTYDGTILNYPFSTGSLSADTWAKVTKIIPGHASLQFDNNANEGITIMLAPFFGTDFTDSGVALDTWAAYGGGTRTPDYTSTWYTTNGATFEFTGVQLEVGSVATPYEHRKYTDELQRCKRYYQHFETGDSCGLLGFCDSSTGFKGMAYFNPHMRAAPSLSIDSAGDYKIRHAGAATAVTAFAIGSGLEVNYSMARLNITVASGLTAGHAAWVGGDSNKSPKIDFDAEL